MANNEARPDSGVLMASTTKRSDKSPDYWGEIAIDLKNLTNVRIEGNLLIFKLSGWKKQAKSGKTYLSLAVDRFVPEGAKQPPRRQSNDGMDDDVPF